MSDAFELSRETCLDLLAAGLVARIAVSTPLGPHLVPVNCSLVDDALIVRTTPYSLLAEHAGGAIVAVEIDDTDYERQRGWSVVVRGRAEFVTQADELDHIQHVWNPNAWASGSRTAYLRVPLTEVTGRQLGRGWDPVKTLPVRRQV